MQAGRGGRPGAACAEGRGLQGARRRWGLLSFSTLKGASDRGYRREVYRERPSDFRSKRLARVSGSRWLGVALPLVPLDARDALSLSRYSVFCVCCIRMTIGDYRATWGRIVRSAAAAARRALGHSLGSQRIRLAAQGGRCPSSAAQMSLHEFFGLAVGLSQQVLFAPAPCRRLLGGGYGRSRAHCAVCPGPPLF